MISIHAPPRGATIASATCRMRSVYFNSRPSARGDLTATYNPIENYISIHAPPRGATTGSDCNNGQAAHFNSRPSARGDIISSNSSLAYAVFQFTPLREGRHNARQIGNLLEISIHAPPRGATRNAKRHPQEQIISIHAPPRGATRSNLRASSI